MPKEKAQAPNYKPIYVGDTYTFTRRGTKQTTSVYVAGVKRDNVKLKRDEHCKDSFTESRAKMDSCYVRVEDATTRCHDECVQRIIGFKDADLEARQAIVKYRMSHPAQFDEFVKSTPECSVGDVALEFLLLTGA